jgi:hypothetical protein
MERILKMTQSQNSTQNSGNVAGASQVPSTILRAKDIFPPFNNRAEEIKPQNTPQARTFPVPDFSLSANQGVSIEPTKNEIPVFDLGMEILANQRKDAAVKRIRPGYTPLPEIKVETKAAVVEIDLPDSDFDDQFNEAFDGEFDSEFEEPEIFRIEENIKLTSHISITRIALTRTEEALINEIVTRDIEKFLKSA